MEAPRSVQVHEQRARRAGYFPKDVHAPKVTQFKQLSCRFTISIFYTSRTNSSQPFQILRMKLHFPLQSRGCPRLALGGSEGLLARRGHISSTKEPGGSGATSVWLSWCTRNAWGHDTRKVRPRWPGAKWEA